jgi:hypothetical protein
MFAAPPGAAGAPRQWGRQPGRRPVGAPALAGGDSPGKAVWGHHEVGAQCALAARQWDVRRPLRRQGTLHSKASVSEGRRPH